MQAVILCVCAAYAAGFATAIAIYPRMAAYIMYRRALRVLRTDERSTV